jgi:hypothetical protein
VAPPLEMVPRQRPAGRPEVGSKSLLVVTPFRPGCGETRESSDPKTSTILYFGVIKCRKSGPFGNWQATRY